MKGFTKYFVVTMISILAINYASSDTSSTIVSRHKQQHEIEKKSRYEKHHKETSKPSFWSKLFSPSKKTYALKEYTVKTLKIHGNNNISSKEIKDTVSPYINTMKRELIKDDINKISLAVEQLYVDKGYLLPAAYVKVSNSTLFIDIIEGKIKNVIILLDNEKRDKKALKNKRLLAYINKIEKAAPIRKRELEKYILLINKIHGYTAEYEIEPLVEYKGTEIANLAIKISTQKGVLSLSADNTGTPKLGKYQFAANAHLYNPISNDSLILNATTSNNPKNFGMITAGYLNRLNTYGTAASVLFSYLHDDPYNTVGSKDSNSTLVKGRLDQYVALNNDYSVKAELGLEHRKMLYYIGSIKSQSYKYYLGSIGGKIKIVDPFDVDNWFYPYYNFTPKKLSYSKSSANPRDFDKNFGYFVLDWYRNQFLKNKFSFLLHASLQYTKDDLPLEHQYSIGAHNTAKGYEQSLTHADSGISGNAELKYTHDLENNKLLETSQIFGFYGITHFINHNKTAKRTKHPGNTYFDKSTLHGAGGGVRMFFVHDIFAEGTAAHPLNKKIMVDGKTHKNNTIFRFLVTKDFKW